MTYSLAVFLGLITHGWIQGGEGLCRGVKEILGQIPPKNDNPQSLARLQISVNHYHIFLKTEEQMKRSSLSREDIVHAVSKGIHIPSQDQIAPNGWHYTMRGTNIKGTKQIYVSLGFSRPNNLLNIYFFKEFPYTSFEPIEDIWVKIPRKLYDISRWAHHWAKERRVHWEIQKGKASRKSSAFRREEILSALAQQVVHRSEEDYYHGGDWFYSLNTQISGGLRVRIMANLVYDSEKDQQNLLIRSVGLESSAFSPPKGAISWDPEKRPHPRPLERAQDIIKNHGLRAVSFTHHAQSRMTERRITLSDFTETIRHGFYQIDDTAYSWHAGDEITAWYYSLRGEVGGRSLEFVISLDKPHTLSVVTAIVRSS